MRPSHSLSLLCLLAATAGASACGDDGPGRDGANFPVDATVRVVATPPADAFVREAAAAFENETDVAVRLEVTTGNRARAAYCGGQAEVAVLPRQRTRRERATCEPPEQRRHAIAHEAVAIVGNPAAAPDCMSSSALQRLWMRASRVDELRDLRAELPAGHIELLGPPRSRTTVDLLRERALEGRAVRAYHAVEDSRVLTQLVGENPRAIAFYGYARVDEHVPGQLKLVALRGRDGCVAPSVASIRSGKYSLAREVHLLGPRADRDSAAAKFAEWAVSNRLRAGLTTEQLVAAKRAGEGG